MKVMDAPNRRHRLMAAPIVTKQQKDLKKWIKLRDKRTAEVKPPKHGKKTSTE